MAEEEEEVEDILKGIRDLLLKEREERDKVFEIIYPPQGGTKTITAGTTEINLYTGEVFLEDSEEKISQSLRSYGVEYARSLFIETTKAIVLQLDDGGKHTVEKLETILWNNLKPFQRLSITATESTNIKVVASTDPNMVLHREDDVVDCLKSGANVKQNKSTVTAINNVTIIKSASNTSSGISLADVKRLAITIKATYGAGTDGITVYIYSSHDNANWDTDELTSFEPSYLASTTKQKTAFIDPDASYIKIKVTNKDSAVSVTGVTVTLTETKETIENG